MCGLDLQDHVCRVTIEFDLLVLSNTDINFVVLQCGVKDMFALFRLSFHTVSLSREAD
jgi:hypothetical protein